MAARHRAGTTPGNPRSARRTLGAALWPSTTALRRHARPRGILVPLVPPDARVLTSHRPLRAALLAGVFGIDLLLWGGDSTTVSGAIAPLWIVVGLGAMGYSCLAFYRSPIPGYLALWILSFGGLVIPALQSAGGFLLALFLVARLTQRHTALAALAAGVVPITVNTLTGASFHTDADLSFILINAGLWAGLLSGVWLAGRALAVNEHRLATERRWAEEARAEATAMERLRISRDLHDSVAHAMTAIVLQVAGVRTASRNGTTPIEIDPVLADVQFTAEQGMRELHRLLGMLRSSDNGSESAHPRGPDDIRELIHSARSSGLDIEATTTGSALPLDPSVAHAAYRVAQEGLSNAMKHAGKGARVELNLHWGDDGLSVAVRSFTGMADSAAPSGGYGLLGLRERISVSGGDLQHGPTPTGYLLTSTLPARAADRTPRAARES